MRSVAFAWACLSLAALGCEPAPAAPPTSPAASTTSPRTAAAPPRAPTKPEGVVTRDGSVGTYVSIPWGFSTSSYWLEGPEGLVAIDTQFLPSAAEDMIAKAEALTGKKFVLAIVLHANPDKFNGTATFQRHGVRVVSSAQVNAVIPEVHEKRLRAFFDRYTPDYPTELPKPESLGSESTELSAAGLKLRVHVLGPGCSEAHIAVEHEGHLFVGDLVANKNHSWLEIGKTAAWLKRLDELQKLQPKRVHPGRGASGPASLLDDEASYLRRVIDLVGREHPSMPVREDALARIEKAIVTAYPDYGFPVFLKIGLPAEWERQARAAQR